LFFRLLLRRFRTSKKFPNRAQGRDQRERTLGGEHEGREPQRGRASEVMQLTRYTISSQTLRISCEGDTDGCSCVHGVY
jgi:hypothetical protein